MNEREPENRKGASPRNQPPSGIRFFRPEKRRIPESQGYAADNRENFWGETGVTRGRKKLPQLETNFKAGNDGAGRASYFQIRWTP
jgi:hypothetical protein